MYYLCIAEQKELRNEVRAVTAGFDLLQPVVVAYMYGG